MTRSPDDGSTMPARQYLTALGGFAAVILAVFGALVGLGALAAVPAAIGAGALLVGCGLLLRTYVDGVGALGDAIDQLLATPNGVPGRIKSSAPAIERIWETVLRLDRFWRQRVRRVEADLASSDNILSALHDPFILVNERREIVRVNAAAAELFGDHLIGRDLAAALRNPSVLNATAAVLKGAEAKIIEFDLSLTVERAMRARIEPLPDPAATGLYAVLVTLTDLTAAKRTEQMRADFVANASHELRTPLSTLIGFIETLQGPALDDREAHRRFLPIMQQQAGRMARLVDELLSLSRIELNEHLPPVEHAQIPSLLKTVANALELKAAARGMRIELDVVEDPPPVIGDPEELAQVFQNLVDNAIKYARIDSVITLTVAPSSKVRPGVAISVRDRGEGIARPHLPRLTERFYRVDTARSRAMGGTGLGLAIVKHIVSRHRGVLDIDSELGEGSVFTIHLRTAAPVRALDSDANSSPALKPGLRG